MIIKTSYLRGAVIILAAIGAISGWWGWSAFYFGLLGGITVEIDGKLV